MTVDQFISNACKLTDKSNGVWGAAYAERFLPWESLLGADGRQVNVTSPETVNAYEALGRGFTEGCAPSVNTLDPWGEGEDFLLQGKLAMVLNGFQDTAKYDKAGINYGFTALRRPRVWSRTSTYGPMASVCWRALTTRTKPSSSLPF